MKKDYSTWSKEELLRELKKVEKRKKYGIVWEDKPEDVATLCKEKLPVLEEDKSKEIVTDKEKPVNILIEGDNYHALSVLNYTHKGKIDVIYIDPPYNTGNEDFIYNDNFVDIEDAYRHSKWLSFMAKRLGLAKHLLKNKGIILISIDDNEFSQLKLLCDEIFGEKNFIAALPTIMNLKGNQDQFGFAGTHEYTLVYAKNIDYARIGKFQIDEEELEEWQNDERGYFKKGANLKSTGKNAPRDKRPNLYFPIFITKDDFYVTEDDKPKDPKDTALYPITDGKEMSWRWEKQKFRKEKYNVIIERNNGNVTIYKKQRPAIGELPSVKPKTIFYKPEYSSGNGTAQIKEIFGEKVFPNPKPIGLIRDFMILSTEKDSMIVDFMAGSGTTGHAIIELNRDDGGSRRFILCTDNQDNNESGLKIASEICYPRLKKVIQDLTMDAKQSVGKPAPGNLKYFKTDFVNAEPTDANKKKMVDKSTEMLCLKEDCFDEVKKNHNFRIFTNDRGKNLGIIYDDDGIEPFKKEITKLKKKFVVYVFSLDDSAREEEFEDIADWVELKPIPAVILNVYRRIFK